MAREQLIFGDVISGLLIDGVEGTPFLGATLEFSRDRGAIIEVPFVPHDSEGQFDHVRSWFYDNCPPTSLEFSTADGTLTLCGVKVSAMRLADGGRTSSGFLRAEDVLVGRLDDENKDTLRVRYLRSKLDGLYDWSGFRAVDESCEHDESGRITGFRVSARPKHRLEWRQGSALLGVRSEWSRSIETDQEGTRVILNDGVWLESAFEYRATVFEHIKEQRKVASLISLLYGEPIFFREHWAKDNSISVRALSGDSVAYPWTQVISLRTVGETGRQQTSLAKKDEPLATLREVGRDGLETWAQNYAKWKRFIVPTQRTIETSGMFVESLVIATATSLEAAGGIIGHRNGEESIYGQRSRKQSFATHVYRCLSVVNVKWPDRAGTFTNLSTKFADVYNTIKHADRGDFPDATDSIFVSKVGLLLVRLLALSVTGRDELLLQFRVNGAFRDLDRWMTTNAIDLRTGQ